MHKLLNGKASLSIVILHQMWTHHRDGTYDVSTSDVECCKVVYYHKVNHSISIRGIVNALPFAASLTSWFLIMAWFYSFFHYSLSHSMYYPSKFC